jgi:hypothetical protein
MKIHFNASDPSVVRKQLIDLVADLHINLDGFNGPVPITVDEYNDFEDDVTRVSNAVRNNAIVVTSRGLLTTLKFGDNPEAEYRILENRIILTTCIPKQGFSAWQLPPASLLRRHRSRLGEGGRDPSSPTIFISLVRSAADKNKNFIILLFLNINTVMFWIIHPIPASRRLLGRWRRQRWSVLVIVT